MSQPNQYHSLHGVMVCIDGFGVLIKGPPGIGKSSLALQLVIEGYQLVADDIVEFRTESHQLIGRAPTILKGLLNTRELGTININQQFGSDSVIDKSRLFCQVTLHQTLMLDSHLEGNQSDETILGIRIPTLQLSLSNPMPVISRLLTWLKMQQSTNNANEQLKYRQQQQIQQ